VLFALIVLSVLFGGAAVRLSNRATSLPPHSVVGTPRSSATGIGDTVTVVRATQANGKEGFWPCGSTVQALDEMIKWAVRGDSNEIKRVMRATGSIGLIGGQRVKVLDTDGWIAQERKVRVESASDGSVYLRDEQGVFLADRRIGRECWVVSEALSH
jgi:hypothetical protein